MCCANLAKHDLELAPLDEIIRPYELLGLHFIVKPVSDTQVMVEMGESHDTIGSGGKFLLDRFDARSYRVAEVPKLWIA